MRDPHTGALIWSWVRDPKKVETVLGFLVRDPLNGTFYLVRDPINTTFLPD